MKIKFRCACSKPLILPAHKFGESFSCPSCKRDQLVPAVSHDSILLWICECSSTHPSGTVVCDSCGLDMAACMEHEMFLATSAPSSIHADQKPATSEIPPPPIPSSSPSLAQGVRVRFQCPCGNTLSRTISRGDPPSPCENCHQPVTIPPLDSPSLLDLQCLCGKSPSTNDTFCRQCGQAIHQEETSTDLASDS